MSRVITREVSDNYGGQRPGAGRPLEPYEGEKSIRFKCTPVQALALFDYYKALTGKSKKRGGPDNTKGVYVFKVNWEQAEMMKEYLETLRSVDKENPV
jgi:hypothetical protein